MTIRLRLALLASAVVPAVACAASVPIGWHSYRDTSIGFSISYPNGWTVDSKFVSVSLGPDHEIKGIAFVIPPGLARGTNLSSDNTQISIESIPGGDCKPSQFVEPAEHIGKLMADRRTYSTAASEDAGAGNRYETLLFVVDGTSPCIAVRYLIHSTNIGNYDPGTVKPFDRDKLIKQFDAVRATLRLSP